MKRPIVSGPEGIYRYPPVSRLLALVCIIFTPVILLVMNWREVWECHVEVYSELWKLLIGKYSKGE